MFKKLRFKGLNYSDLDRYDSHDLKRDEMHSFYQTFDFFDLIKLWPNIVGPKLSQVTSPLKLKQDALYIITKHSSYSQELSFLSETIKKEIFKAIPKLKPVIKKIMYQTQESFFEQHRVSMGPETTLAKKIHPQSPQYKIYKMEAERLFQDIQDPDLKEMMISIYVQSR